MYLRLNPRLKFALLALMAMTLACSLPSNSDPSSQNAAPATATEINATTERNEVIEPTPAAADVSPQSAATSGSDQIEVTPDDSAPSINLSAYTVGEVSTPNRSEHLQLSWNGHDENGEPLNLMINLRSQIQTLPAEAEATQIMFERSGESTSLAETAVIGDQYYWFETEGGCFVQPSSDVDETFAEALRPDVPLLDEAFLYEANVEVNGILANHYLLTEDNLAEVAGEDALDTTQIELVEGSVFIAQEGNYITRLELICTAPGSSGMTEGFSGATAVHYLIDIIGSSEALDIQPPTGCAGNTPEDFDYPMMSDAQGLISVPNGIFYESAAPLEDVVAFYRQEMAAQGWTLVEETIIGSLYELFFEKNDLRVRITAAQNGDLVPVNIEEIE